MLYDADKQGKYAMLTIDMQSKTVPDKNRAQQWYVMGLKGMSLQGGMVKFVQNGVMEQHYVDLVYSAVGAAGFSSRAIPETIGLCPTNVEILTCLNNKSHS